MKAEIDISTPAARIQNSCSPPSTARRSSFIGRRGKGNLEASSPRAGDPRRGGQRSIIGRNTFQRPK